MPAVQLGKLHTMSFVLALIDPYHVGGACHVAQSLPRRHGNYANIQGVGKRIQGVEKKEKHIRVCGAAPDIPSGIRILFLTFPQGQKLGEHKSIEGRLRRPGASIIPKIININYQSIKELRDDKSLLFAQTKNATGRSLFFCTTLFSPDKDADRCKIK